tara:strand:+ start:865 stop:1659 length:795 start_codon:yes stop_codon:yes gene_type:complete
MYNILCAGCSFTHGNYKREVTYVDRKTSVELVDDDPLNPRWYPYANYLPGKTYNIGKWGLGISPRYFRLFFDQNRDVKLTHVIYQVPSPTRQPVDLNNYNEDHFRLRIGGRDKYAFINGHTYVHYDGKLEEVSINEGTRRTPDNDFEKTIYNELRKPNLQVFDKIEEYHKKAIDVVNINVNLIRENHPNAKIIFLRYEDTRKPLQYEFTKNFYKNTLANYCEKNNFSYIYEENFNTRWFKKHKLGIHPNKAGAKLIADKIKEYL